MNEERSRAHHEKMAKYYGSSEYRRYLEKSFGLEENSLEGEDELFSYPRS